jgi:hypothetical protein
VSDTCAHVITWLQTLTVASLMLNVFLGGLVAYCVWEIRRAP